MSQRPKADRRPASSPQRRADSLSRGPRRTGRAQSMSVPRDAATPAVTTQDLMRVIQQGLAVNRHVDLLRWLQGDVQRVLPHEILLACWGQFGAAGFHIDVISRLPSIRTLNVIDRNIEPAVHRLRERWRHGGGHAVKVAIPTGIAVTRTATHCDVADMFGAMRVALVHGLNDQRGRQECCYIALTRRPTLPPITPRAFEWLLPSLDTALRGVAHLPIQYPHGPATIAANGAALDPGFTALGLSEREAEIMRWVRAGKTNHEIGRILSISAFTVKNHLKRIYTKLDVRNRAQAVARLAIQ